MYSASPLFLFRSLCLVVQIDFASYLFLPQCTLAAGAEGGRVRESTMLEGRSCSSVGPVIREGKRY